MYHFALIQKRVCWRDHRLVDFSMRRVTESLHVYLSLMENAEWQYMGYHAAAGVKLFLLGTQVQNHKLYQALASEENWEAAALHSVPPLWHG